MVAEVSHSQGRLYVGLFVSFVDELKSSAFTYAALAATSLVMGYWFGVGSTLPITRENDVDTNTQTKEKPEETESEDTSEDESYQNEKLSAIQPSPMEENKLVVLIPLSKNRPIHEHCRR